MTKKYTLLKRGVGWGARVPLVPPSLRTCGLGMFQTGLDHLISKPKQLLRGPDLLRFTLGWLNVYQAINIT